jgi:hypothetical protein
MRWTIYARQKKNTNVVMDNFRKKYSMKGGEIPRKKTAGAA